MVSDEVVRLAKQVDPNVTGRMISATTGGFSSEGYEVAATKPFVLLRHRPEGLSTPKYSNAFVVLKMLEKHGFQHAPRALWLADDFSALAMTSVAGVTADKFDFSSAHLSTRDLAIQVMDGLIDLTNVSWQEYESAAHELGFKPLPQKLASASAKQFGTDWLNIVVAHCPDPYLIEWLSKRVPRSVTAMSKHDSLPAIFSHGDSSDPNIIIQSDGSWMLIDWDESCFSRTTIPGIIAYATHVVEFMRPNRSAIINHVAKRLDIVATDLAQQVEDYRKINEVYDVNWAAMMMGRVNDGQVEGDLKKFRKIAYDRIKIYEDSFGSD